MHEQLQLAGVSTLYINALLETKNTPALQGSCVIHARGGPNRLPKLNGTQIISSRCLKLIQNCILQLLKGHFPETLRESKLGSVLTLMFLIPTRYSQCSFFAIFLHGNACTFSNNALPLMGRINTQSHSLQSGINHGCAVQYGNTTMHLANGHYFCKNITNLGSNATGG